MIRRPPRSTPESSPTSWLGAFLRARNAFVGILAVCGGFVGAVLLHAQANGVGFLAPEDSWNLTYGAIELPVTAVAITLLVWGVRRRRATLEA